MKPLSCTVAAALATAAVAAGPVVAPTGLRTSFVTGGPRVLWATSRGEGTLARVDETTGRVTRRIVLGGDPFGVATDGRAVWVANANGTVARVDAATGRVSATIATGGRPYAVCLARGGVWVSDAVDGVVLRIDPRTNRVVRQRHVGVEPNGLAYAFGRLWVADYGAGRLLALDPVTGAARGSVRLAGADWITAGAGSLWVSQEVNRVARVDPRTLRVLARIPVPANPLASAWVRGRLWVPSIDGNAVTVIDPRTNRVVRRIADDGGPGGLVRGTRGVWAADSNGDGLRLIR